jgi:hypothetical protein
MKRKCESIMFECEGIENKENVYNCLIKLGINYQGDKKNVQSIDGLIEYITQETLPINILYNSFHLKKTLLKIHEDNGIERKRMDIGKRKNELFIVSKLYPSDYQPVYKYHVPFAEHTIIYDKFHKHFDVMSSVDPILKEDIRIDRASNIHLGDKILFKPSQLNFNTEVYDC